MLKASYEAAITHWVWLLPANQKIVDREKADSIQKNRPPPNHRIFTYNLHEFAQKARLQSKLFQCGDTTSNLPSKVYHDASQGSTRRREGQRSRTREGSSCSRAIFDLATKHPRRYEWPIYNGSFPSSRTLCSQNNDPQERVPR